MAYRIPPHPFGPFSIAPLMAALVSRGLLHYLRPLGVCVCVHRF